MAKHDPIRAYIADLAAYNNGELRGEWFELSDYSDAEEFEKAVVDYIGKIPGREEWAIHDHEGFQGIEIGEYMALSEVFEIAQLLGDHGEAYGAYVGNVGLQYATREGFEEHYCGEYDSGKDYAQEFFEETSDKKDLLGTWPFSCIDWEHAWNELSNDGYSIINGHVFRP